MPARPGSDPHRGHPTRFRSALLTLWPLLLALVIVGPLLGPGYLLARDAVSTPRSFFTDAALGVADAAPRAVPQDVLVAALSSIGGGGIFNGGAVVVTILVLSLWAAGAGASAMVGELVPASGIRDFGGRFAAATVAVWNPYVAERLTQGHWSLLAGYAALPWLVWAGIRARRRDPLRPLAVFLLALACAGLTPTGAVLGLAIALPVAALPGGWRGVRGWGCRRWVRVLVVLAAFTAVAAPWWITAAVTGAGGTSDPAGVDAFAARAETGLGTLGSLAGLGGIWNAQAVPWSRVGAGAVLGTLALLAVVACGVRGVWRRRANPVVCTLAVIAVLAVALPALGATSPGLVAGRWAVANVPGAGLFRDGQKWVALAMPAYALAAALGGRAAGAALGQWATGAARKPGLTPPARAQARALLAAALIVSAVVIAALPSLAWGVGGALRPVHYPPAWDAVARVLNDPPTSDDSTAPHAQPTPHAHPASGAIAVLPAGAYRDFPWTHGPVLDPAPRYFRPNTLVTGDLVVSGDTVGGEGGRARRVQASLLAGAAPSALASDGVRWVLVEHRTPGDLGESARTLANLDRVFSDADLSLYRVPGDITEHAAPASARAWSWVGHGLWAATGLAGLALLAELAASATRCRSLRNRGAPHSRGARRRRGTPRERLR